MNRRQRKKKAKMQAFNAASTGRKFAGWIASSAGPNAALNPKVSRLNNRSREEYTNNVWVKRGIDSLVNNEVGTGIVPSSKSADEDFKVSANRLWDEQSKFFDANGVLSIYGLQEQCARARRMSGECFIRRRVRRNNGSLPVSLQFQVLESDFVPAHMNRDLPNGNIIRAGIELNKSGRRVAYHIYPEHPGDGGRSMNMTPLRIPASQIIHHYLPTRPGQLRGEIAALQSLPSAKDFNEYSDYELTRKKTRAGYTGWIERMPADGEPYDPVTGQNLGGETDGSGGAVEPPPFFLDAGTIVEGQPGEKLTLYGADDGGAGQGDYNRWSILGVAAGMNIPYEILSGDWSNVNDRLVRAIQNDFRRMIEAHRESLMVHQVCCGIWEWFIQMAIFNQALKPANDFASNRADYLSCQWTPQGWPYTSPKEDIKAAEMAIASNLTTWEEEARKRSTSVAANIKANAETERLRQEQFKDLQENQPDGV